MRTLVCIKPGELEYEERDQPVLQTGHAIIKIKRIGICGTDLHAFEGTQPFFDYPRVLGHELAGELVAVDGTQYFHIGQIVSFVPYFHCGECIACRTGSPNCCVRLKVLGVHVDGGFCEYLSVPAHSLIQGDGLSLDELSLVEPLAIGAHGVRRAGIQAGEFVLVVGAGPIGLGVAEFARIAGGHVIMMDVNENRLEFCKENLGVIFDINPLKDDVIVKLKTITGGDMPTVVIDATGNLAAINKSFSYMAPTARYVLVGLQKGDIFFSHPEFHRREGTLMSSRNATRHDFEYVIDCIRTRIIDPTKYITHRVQFNQVKDNFASWLKPQTGVIKATVEMP